MCKTFHFDNIHVALGELPICSNKGSYELDYRLAESPCISE